MRRSAWVVLVLVVVIAAGVGGIWLLQQSLSGPELRRTLTADIERRTGRQVSLGAVSVGLLPNPRLEADEVILGNPAVLSIGHVRASIGIWPLLRHTVRIGSLSLDHVTLRLARDASGRDNWWIKPETLGGPATPHAHGPRWRVELASMAIDGAEVSFHDARAHHGAALHLGTLDADDVQGSRPRLRLAGWSHGATYRVAGTVGPVTLLFADRTAAAWPVSLRGSESIAGTVVGNARVSGTISRPARARGYDLTASVRLSNLDVLNRLFPHARLASVQRLDAAVRVVDAGRPAVSLLHASAGATAIPRLPDLDVRSWSLAAAAPGSPLTLAANAVWRDAPLTLTGTIAPQPHGGVSVTGLRLVSVAGELDGALSLASRGRWTRLDAAAGDLSLRSATLTIDGHAYQDLSVDATLKDGRLLVAPLQAQGVLVRLAADFGGARPRFLLWMHPAVVPAVLLERLLGGPLWLRGDVEAAGQVEAEGTTRSALLASASGHVGVSMIDGRVANAALLSLLGHGAMTAAALPRGGETTVSCLALHGTLGGGTLMLDTVSLRTARLALDGGGRVGLGGGGLDLHLIADALLGVASASLPLHVGGTLQDPHPLLAATAPGGRYALTIGPNGADEAGCAASLQKAREGAVGPQPTPRKIKAPRGIDILRGLGLVH